jgi:hypothetical protein
MVRKVMTVLGVAAVFLSANVFAAGTETHAKPKKPESVPNVMMNMRLDGTVSVAKDANGVVTSIKLTTTDKTVYNVKLDEKGKELGGFDGKEVTVRGVITEKNGQKWIEVHGLQLVNKNKKTPLTKPRATEK